MQPAVERSAGFPAMTLVIYTPPAIVYMPTTLTIHDIPLRERPRERLHRHGPMALSAVELVAILLGSGLEGRSALDVGRELLAGCQGSLKRLANRPVASLTAVRGVGMARAISIHAALELGRLMMAEDLGEGSPLERAEDIYKLYAPQLENLPVEEFHVGALDARHRLENDILITRGILNASPVHPREVFRSAIAQNACAVILVHNHPSGDPTPSVQDIQITSQLVSAGKVLGIEVLDHVIIGRGRFTSFAEDGILI